MHSPGNSIFIRISKYCAEAERCTHDVLTKLISWGVPLEESDIIMARLRAEKFLDDKRFTQSYVSEKWNIDHWGKIKIENALLQKNIDPIIIQEALAIIDHEEYVEALNALLEKKYKEARNENSLEDARRLMMFALGRGYEEELIKEWLEKKGFELLDP